MLSNDRSCHLCTVSRNAPTSATLSKLQFHVTLNGFLILDKLILYLIICHPYFSVAMKSDNAPIVCHGFTVTCSYTLEHKFQMLTFNSWCLLKCIFSIYWFVFNMKCRKLNLNWMLQTYRLIFSSGHVFFNLPLGFLCAYKHASDFTYRFCPKAYINQEEACYKTRFEFWRQRLCCLFCLNVVTPAFRKYNWGDVALTVFVRKCEWRYFFLLYLFYLETTLFGPNMTHFDLKCSRYSFWLMHRIEHAEMLAFVPTLAIYCVISVILSLHWFSNTFFLMTAIWGRAVKQ